MHNKYSWLIRRFYHVNQEVKPDRDAYSKDSSDYSFSQICVDPVNWVNYLDAIRCSKTHSNYEEQDVYVVEGLVQPDSVLWMSEELISALLFLNGWTPHPL